jgi:hypothetical protein
MTEPTDELDLAVLLTHTAAARICAAACDSYTRRKGVAKARTVLDSFNGDVLSIELQSLANDWQRVAREFAGLHPAAWSAAMWAHDTAETVSFLRRLTRTTDAAEMLRSGKREAVATMVVSTAWLVADAKVADTDRVGTTLTLLEGWTGAEDLAALWDAWEAAALL